MRNWSYRAIATAGWMVVVPVLGWLLATYAAASNCSNLAGAAAESCRQTSGDQVFGMVLALVVLPAWLAGPFIIALTFGIYRWLSRRP